MILRMIQQTVMGDAEHKVEKVITHREIVIENNIFEITPAFKEDMSKATFCVVNGIEDTNESRLWKVYIDDKMYIFQLAYLMNNDGKTIEKYD